jgi:hypothetical protein
MKKIPQTIKSISPCPDFVLSRRYFSRPKISSFAPEISAEIFRLLDIEEIYDDAIRIFDGDSEYNLYLLHYLYFIPEIAFVRGIIIQIYTHKDTKEQKVRIVAPGYGYPNEFNTQYYTDTIVQVPLSLLDIYKKEKDPLDIGIDKTNDVEMLKDYPGTIVRVYTIKNIHGDSRLFISSSKMIKDDKLAGRKLSLIFPEILGQDPLLALNFNWQTETKNDGLRIHLSQGDLDHRLERSDQREDHRSTRNQTTKTSELPYSRCFFFLIQHVPGKLIGHLTVARLRGVFTPTGDGMMKRNNWMDMSDCIMSAKLLMNKDILVSLPDSLPELVQRTLSCPASDDSTGFLIFNNMCTRATHPCIRLLHPLYVTPLFLSTTKNYLSIILKNYDEAQKYYLKYPEYREMLDMAEKELSLLPYYIQDYYTISDPNRRISQVDDSVMIPEYLHCFITTIKEWRLSTKSEESSIILSSPRKTTCTLLEHISHYLSYMSHEEILNLLYNISPLMKNL